ncbi:DUF433 domain-containing protein [Kutzneria sp. NPDC051319]|uniref:DUF433 domain-containing protein n=1 Tax=Kutzneria sp. NPDC051319 TaxID=3155047 RepID=UPI003413B3FB
MSTAVLEQPGADELRFDVPLYTQVDASRALAMRASTFSSWARGYQRRRVERPPVVGRPLVTYVPPARAGDPSIPFVGLAEAAFLASLRAAGVPLQRIRPALELVRDRLGVEHALASQQLYTDGADLLWEVTDRDENTRAEAKKLVVLRNGQYVFRKVVQDRLRGIHYAADGFADVLVLPDYEIAKVIADPNINFGRPSFAGNGVPVDAVVGQVHAGDPIEDVAADFRLSVDEVTEAVFRAERVG